MPIHRTTLLIAAIAAALTSEARAEPLDRRVVPADAKFVVSVDVDAARASSVGKAINDKLAAVPEYQRKIAQVSVVTGMTYPQDLHDVTLYAREMGDEAVVVVAHAHMDRQRMLTALSTTPDHATHHVGAYDVARWTDDGKTMFGAFHDDGTLVIARSEANVTAALNTIDGKTPAAAADGPVSGTAPASTRPAVDPHEHPLLFLALADVPGLAKSRGGVEVPAPLQQVEGGCLAVAEVGGTLSLRVNLTAKTADAAEQLRTAAEGLRAMVALTAAGTDARSDLRQAAPLLSRTKFGRADRTVTADATIPADALSVTANTKTFAVGLDPAKLTTRPAAGK